MPERLKCPNPECGRDDGLYSCELIPGRCAIDAQLTEDGDLDYWGDETNVDWNGQRTVTDENGHPRLGCAECGTQWFEEKATIKNDGSNYNTY